MDFSLACEWVPATKLLKRQLGHANIRMTQQFQILAMTSNG
ncbi:MAG: hypothetical protein AAF215_05610 [Cyanobacteria bacterium P01_A01_bin.123]